MDEKTIRLGVIAPYPEFGELIREVCRDFPVSLKIEQAILGEAVVLARRWQDEDAVDVVITRGPTARMIERSIKLPVSPVEITNFDIIKTLHYARSNYEGPMAFIDYCYQAPKYDFALFRQMLGIDFHLYTYKDNEDIYRQLELAIARGMRTVIATGSCIFYEAARRGVNTVYVRSSRESVAAAVRWAVRLARIKRENAFLTEKLSFILNNIHDGVLAFDENKDLFFFNPEAEKMTGLRSREVMGKSVQELLQLEPFSLLYRDGGETSGELVRLRGLELVVNRIPIHIGYNNCLVISFQSVRKIRHMEEKIRQKLYAKGLVARYNFRDIVGNSRALQGVVEQARKYADTNSTVLITGESGTGKELFAHSIHNAGLRKDGPFVAVNCAALPENLLESELFGYEEGAFTGARRGGKPGLFELAHGGTIFLDEVGEVSLHLQARLLRVIQQKEVMRVGGDRVLPIDVRVIAATNRDLDKEVEKGNFREDLYYRLNVLSLEIPPLRCRPDDIPVLFRYFLKRLGGGAAVCPPQQVQAQLKLYSWPGNVRELENFVERYYAIGEEDPEKFVTFRRLIDKLLDKKCATETGNRITIEVGSLEDMERQILQQLTRHFSNRKVELANFLGISRSTLWRKLRSSGDDWVN